jgi:uncharacterized protein (DUF1684 family)
MSNFLVRGGLLLSFGVVALSTYGQSDLNASKEINDHRKKQQAEMRDRNESPLSKKDRRHFKGLNYYPIDLSYRVKARFVKTENPCYSK